jgi:hypothetical protein
LLSLAYRTGILWERSPRPFPVLPDISGQDGVLLPRPPPPLQPHLLAARRPPHAETEGSGGQGREVEDDEELEWPRRLASGVYCGVCGMAGAHGRKKVEFGRPGFGSFWRKYIGDWRQ